MDKLKDKLNATREAMKKLKNSERDFIDILDIPKEFTQRLTDNKIISRSDDMQIKSVREVTKLGIDLTEE